MPLIPDRLNYGDTIGIIAPASAPPDPQNIDRSVEALERLGFKPKLAPNARKRLGFLAGNDCDRARDLMRMFTDRKVKAIICVRGGYGTSRLLPGLITAPFAPTPRSSSAIVTSPRSTAPSWSNPTSSPSTARCSTPTS